MSDDSAQLDYQQSTPRWRRKWIRRGLVALIILAGVGASFPVLIKEFKRVRLLRLYDACAVSPAPSVARSEIAGRLSVSHFPREWNDLNAGIWAYIPSSGTIFLGKLTTPDRSREFLVGVDLVSRSRAPTIITMRARTISRGGPFQAPYYGQASDQSVILPNYVERLVIAGGVIDPGDRSHFTVGYQADDAKGIIDGWLKDDETVILEPRAGAAPATAPAPPLPARSR
jgi:hypothetical protein